MQLRWLIDQSDPANVQRPTLQYADDNGALDDDESAWHDVPSVLFYVKHGERRYVRMPS